MIALQEAIAATASTTGAIVEAPGIDSDGLPRMVDAGDWSEMEVKVPEPIITGILEACTKAAIIGPAKCRKSFIALQLALLIALGINFLKFKIPRPRVVLLWQAEVPDGHYHKRLRRMIDGLGVSPADLGGRLKVVNGRGFGFCPHHEQALTDRIRKEGIEVLILDPLYKFLPLDGDESDQATVRSVLAFFDRVAKETGVTIMYVHHTPKGVAGDRQAIDSASGSGLWARDFDTQFTLTPHVEDELLVLRPIVRLNPPQEAISLKFTEAGVFEQSDAPPVVRTSANRRDRSASAPFTDDQVLAVLAVGEVVPATVLRQRLEGSTTQRRAKAAFDAAIDSGKLAVWRKPIVNGPKLCGRPEDVKRAQDEWQNPQLPGLGRKGG